MTSVDPGVNGSAIAEWAGNFLRAAKAGCRPRVQLVDLLVIEKPVVYQGRKQKGDPNDLIDLAIVVGQWVEANPVFQLVKPRDWKGQVPKKIMTARILSKLTSSELAALGELKKNHNVVDAVGLGLWKLGRL